VVAVVLLVTWLLAQVWGVTSVLWLQGQAGLTVLAARVWQARWLPQRVSRAQALVQGILQQ
jgi:hypothetical protein